MTDILAISPEAVTALTRRATPAPDRYGHEINSPRLSSAMLVQKLGQSGLEDSLVCNPPTGPLLFSRRPSPQPAVLVHWEAHTQGVPVWCPNVCRSRRGGFVLSLWHCQRVRVFS
jgi:hypothetical protein